MMPVSRAVSLTQAAIEALPDPAAGRTEYFDAAVPGFAVRVSNTGHRAYVLFYRHAGRQRRFTIGDAKAITLEYARTLAREALLQVAQGADPLAGRSTVPTARPGDPRRLDTVVAGFIERHARRRNRSWQQAAWVLRKHVLLRWGERPIDSIGRGDVQGLIDALMANGTPAMANRTLSHVRKLFNWAVDQAILDVSPAIGVRALIAEAPRTRSLDDEEVARLWAGCGQLGHPHGGLIRFLLVTAQRRTDVVALRWADVGLETGLWRLPREDAAGTPVHSVPLSSLALEILLAAPRRDAHVFAAAGGFTPVEYGRARRRLDRETGLAGWHVQDLRRTAIRHMAALGTPSHVLHAILDDRPVLSPSGLAGVVASTDYDAEKRQALELWARRLQAIVAA